MYLNLEYFDSLMKENDYTLLDVVLRSGVSETQIRRMRNGLRNPGEKTAKRLIKAFPEAKAEKLFSEDSRINEIYYCEKGIDAMQSESNEITSRQEVDYILRNYEKEMRIFLEEQRKVQAEMIECNFDHVKNFYSGIGFSGETAMGMTINKDLLSVVESCYQTEVSYNEMLMQRYWNLLKKREKYRLIYDIYVDLEAQYHTILYYIFEKNMTCSEVGKIVYLSEKRVFERKKEALNMIVSIYNSKMIKSRYRTREKITS